MVPEPENTDEQVTIGGPWVAPEVGEGTLYVGPPEDPDRYELLGGGTRGGEGRTWRANYQGGLKRPLVEAVKMLFPPAGRSGEWPIPSDLRRWHDNAALLRHLAQPHVVQLHDIFGGDFPHTKGSSSNVQSVAYLTMEWVEGPTLAEHLHDQPVTSASLAERLQYVHDIATAVASLHSSTRSSGNPVLHRDLTPANCIVHADRGIVLIDISTMRLVDDGFDPLGRHTPAYTAPEVLRAPHAPRLPSSDLYAVGAVTVFILTGRPPETILESELTELLKEAGSREPRAAVRHLLRLLDPEPDLRPSDILTWSRTLRSLASSRSRQRSVLVPAAAVVAAGLAITTAVYAINQDQGPPKNLGAAEVATNTTPGPVRDASKGISPHDFSSASGRIITPVTKQKVRDCEYVTGTAAPLPPGQTLIVTQHNRNESDDMRYLQVTYDYKKPEKLTTWRTANYFNDQAVGQDLVLELIELPLTSALESADANHGYALGSALAGQGKVLAAVTVTHVKKRNPRYPCPGPGSAP